MVVRSLLWVCGCDEMYLGVSVLSGEWCLVNSVYARLIGK